MPLAAFPRLTESLLRSEGEVEVQLAFRKARKHRSLVVGEGKITVSLECQNCLAPVDVELVASLRHVIVRDEEVLLGLEEDEDGIVCPEDMVSIVELLEDELILALPMVAKHSDTCGVEGFEADSTAGEDTDIAAETHRPFAGLADLKDEIIGASHGRTEK